MDNRSETFRRILQVRIDHFLALNRTAEAQALIEQELAKIELQKPKLVAPALDQTGFNFRRNEWIRKLGIVAEKENRIDDALTLYQTSLKGLPAQALNNERFPWQR